MRGRHTPAMQRTNRNYHSAKCLLPSSQSLQERLFVGNERDVKHCSPVCLPHESGVRRTELVLHREIAWALTGFICSICIFLLGMLSLGFIFIIKGLSAAQFWCNASCFWNPGEVCLMLRCIRLSGSLKRLVEAKPKSLDRHDCSEKVQYLWWRIFFCNIKRGRISGCFLQYYILCLFVGLYIRLYNTQN